MAWFLESLRLPFDLPGCLLSPVWPPRSDSLAPPLRPGVTARPRGRRLGRAGHGHSVPSSDAGRLLLLRPSISSPWRTGKTCAPTWATSPSWARCRTCARWPKCRPSRTSSRTPTCASPSCPRCLSCCCRPQTCRPRSTSTCWRRAASWSRGPAPQSAAAARPSRSASKTRHWWRTLASSWRLPRGPSSWWVQCDRAKRYCSNWGCTFAFPEIWLNYCGKYHIVSR